MYAYMHVYLIMTIEQWFPNWGSPTTSGSPAVILYILFIYYNIKINNNSFF